MSRPHFLTPILSATTPWILRVDGTDRRLATAAALAGSSDSRRRGLLGRDGMADGEALVIAPTQGVHTFGMRFPIDVVGVDRLGRVTSIRRGVPKGRIVFSWKAFAIVELASGATDQASLRVGDVLRAEPSIPPF